MSDAATVGFRTVVRTEGDVIQHKDQFCKRRYKFMDVPLSDDFGNA